MADAEKKSELETLAPEPRQVPVRGSESVAVREFYFGQWPRAIRLFRPVTEAVTAAGIAGFNGQGLALAADWPMLLPRVMDEAGEALIEFVRYAINKDAEPDQQKPRAWFDKLGGDDGIALTRAVFEVNGDFFVQRIAPSLGLAVQPAGGEQLSPASSEPTTPETKSTE